MLGEGLGGEGWGKGWGEVGVGRKGWEREGCTEMTSVDNVVISASSSFSIHFSPWVSPIFPPP